MIYLGGIGFSNAKALENVTNAVKKRKSLDIFGLL
jgi:hypothetical protein